MVAVRAPGKRFPFLRPGLALGIACAAGVYAGLDLAPTGRWTAAAGLILVLGGLLAAWARSSRVVQRLSFLGFFTAAGFLAGLWTPKGGPVPAMEAAARSETPVRFVGRVAEPLNRRLAAPRWRTSAPQQRLTLVVDVDAVEIDGAWKPTRARAMLGTEDIPFEAGVGDEVEGAALFLSPEGPANPGEPDSRARLSREGVSYLGALQRGALAATRFSTGFPRRAERFRESFTAFVRGVLGDGDRAALVAALAVGERSGVSVSLADAFNTSGLAHTTSENFAWLNNQALVDPGIFGGPFPRA